MLSCKEVSCLISQGMDRELSLVERLSLNLHLMVCDMCRNFVKHMELIRQACRRYSDGPPGGD